MFLFKKIKDNKIKDKISQYPCCDHLNLAVRFLSQNDKELALEEIYYAMIKSHCYFYSDVAERFNRRGFSVPKGQINK